MKQRRLLELVKDYDCTLLYHPSKAVVVAEALSGKSGGQLAFLPSDENQLVKEFEKMKLEVVVFVNQITSQIMTLMIQPNLKNRIIEAQDSDSFLQKIRSEVRSDKMKDFELSPNKALKFKGMLCVPKNEELRKKILEEAHSTPYAAHPEGTKMYGEL